MTFLTFLNQLGQQETSPKQECNPRRAALKSLCSLGAKIAISAVPFTFVTSNQKAYGQSMSTQTVDALNLVLVMEYLQHQFYTRAIDAPGLIPIADLPAIKQIHMQQAAHIALLKDLLGVQAAGLPVFEFNPGGTPYSAYAMAFKYYIRFVNIAFTFHDLSNRIYQGCIAELVGRPDLLKQLFDMHSIEARHSAHLRYIFSKIRSGGSEAPWVQPPVNADTNYSFVIPMYYDEENTIQLGINSSSEGAYDEFMKPADAKKILNVFLVSPRYQV